MTVRTVDGRWGDDAYGHVFCLAQGVGLMGAPGGWRCTTSPSTSSTASPACNGSHSSSMVSGSVLTIVTTSRSPASSEKSTLRSSSARVARPKGEQPVAVADQAVERTLLFQPA